MVVDRIHNTGGLPKPTGSRRRPAAGRPSCRNRQGQTVEVSVEAFSHQEWTESCLAQTCSATCGRKHSEAADASSGDEAESLLKEAKAQVPTSHILGCENMVCRRACCVSLIELEIQHGWPCKASISYKF